MNESRNGKKNSNIRQVDESINHAQRETTIQHIFFREHLNKILRQISRADFMLMYIVCEAVRCEMRRGDDSSALELNSDETPRHVVIVAEAQKVLIHVPPSMIDDL